MGSGQRACLVAPALGIGSCVACDRGARVGSAYGRHQSRQTALRAPIDWRAENQRPSVRWSLDYGSGVAAITSDVFETSTRPRTSQSLRAYS